MPLLKIDYWIPQNLNTVWLYHSWLLLPLITVLLLPCSNTLKRYGWSVFAVNAVSFLFFLCYPTEAPRPEDLSNAPLLYLWTIRIDKPLNACPSLHASVTILCSFFCCYVLGRYRKAWLWRIAVLIWGAGILWSTLATRQHVFIDMISGSVLGGTIAFVALRRPRTNNNYPKPTPLPQGVERAF